MTTTSGDGNRNPRDGYGRLDRIIDLRAQATTPALNGIAEQIQRMCTPAGGRLTEQIDGLFRDAMAPVREQINGLLRDAIPPVRAGWAAQVADMLNTTTASTGSRRDLLAILNQFDEIARNNPDLDSLLPDGPTADLGEIGEDGLAFVNAEGVGLSWEMQRRMFLAFILLAVFGPLMTLVVSSETVSGVLEDAAVPSTVATAALLAASRKWDEKFPRPEGDGEAEGTAGE
ncbi:hypothetical protein ACFV10_28680 [Streptomyces cyaneofuscatus]|uniref:hypothetical protein n=1 Tax=Streptomyces cyaneofuscatus TaxID=66883 RepID=UPI0036AE5F93